MLRVRANGETFRTTIFRNMFLRFRGPLKCTMWTITCTPVTHVSETTFTCIKCYFFDCITLQMKLKNVVTTKQEKLLSEKVKNEAG